MILYADGCSMTYGAELVGTPKEDQLNPELRKSRAWPKHLADLMGIKSINAGVGGSSNEGITRRTLENLGDLKETIKPYETLVVIGWTVPYRYEYWSNENKNWSQVNFNSLHRLPKYTKRHFIRFFSSFHCDRYYQSRMTRQIILMQSYLKYHGYNYLFFPALERFEGYPGIEGNNLWEQIDEKHVFLGESFFRKNINLNLPIAPRMHPLEPGHITWANILYREISSRFPNLPNSSS